MLRQFPEGTITGYICLLIRWLRLPHQYSADALTEGPVLAYHRLGRVQAQRSMRSF